MSRAYSRSGETTVLHPPFSVLHLFKDSPILQSVAARRAELTGAGRSVTRFAPSPTGSLHLGHVAHALWVWGVADALGATVVIRMEDHDAGRSSRASEGSILDDLEWLGFRPDAESLWSLRSGDPSPWRQSDNEQLYAAAADRLSQVTEVYGCSCTRSMLGAPDEDGERFYAGTCRGMPRDRPGVAAWRAHLPENAVEFTDLHLGQVTQHPATEYGDVVIRNARGEWTYQFCVVVDDMRHGVNLVVRGDDLLASTGRQQLLGALLGRTTPVMTLHHPLLTDSDGRKLSKRDGSDTVSAMRARGMTAEDVVMEAWVLSGLSEKREA